MRKLFCIPIILFLFAGCSALQGKTNVDLAVNLNEAYQTALENYNSSYESASKDTKEYMQSEIAPILNKVRDKLLTYNHLTLNGLEDTQTRKEIISLIAELGMKLEDL